MAGVGRIVRSIAKSLGNRYEIYSPTGEYLGIEKQFTFPVKRSVDEHVASFGRTAIFHNKTRLTEGSTIVDLSDGEKYFVNSKRSLSFQDELTVWSVFLLQINCVVDFFRKELVILDENSPSDAEYQILPIYEDIPGYLQKKDWTMATMTQLGRDERGYESLIVKMLDLQKGDRAKIEDKAYIIQDISKTIRENMLEIQLGLEVKDWSEE